MLQLLVSMSGIHSGTFELLQKAGITSLSPSSVALQAQVDPLTLLLLLVVNILGYPLPSSTQKTLPRRFHHSGFSLFLITTNFFVCLFVFFFNLFSMLFVYIPNAFPFPSSPLPICPISPLLSTQSPITPSHFSVLVFPYNHGSSLSGTRAFSFLLLGNHFIC